MRTVVVTLDVVHVDRRLQRAVVVLVEVAQPAVQVGELTEVLAVRFEVNHVDLVEADERDEETDVGLSGGLGALHQPPTRTEHCVELLETLEE